MIKIELIKMIKGDKCQHCGINQNNNYMLKLKDNLKLNDNNYTYLYCTIQCLESALDDENEDVTDENEKMTMKEFIND